MLKMLIDPFPKWRQKIQIRQTYTSTRKNTFALVTLESFSILSVISTEKM